MKYNFFAVTLLALSISACGGGSGGGSNNPEPTPDPTPNPEPSVTLELSLNQSSISIDEDSNKDVLFSSSYNGSGTLSYSVSISNSSLSATVSGDKISIDTPEISSPLSGVLTLTVTDGTVSDSESLSIDVINTSLESIILAYESIQESKSEFINLTEDKRLAKFYSDAAYIKGIIPSDEVSLLSNSIVSYQDRNVQQLEIAYENVESKFNEYKNNGADESVIAEEIASLEQKMMDYFKGSALVINDFNTSKSLNFPVLSEDTLTFIEDKKAYSRLVGDENIGSYNDDGQWSFNSNLAWLERLTVGDSKFKTCSTGA